MPLPNYKNGSIVNLMSSLLQSYGKRTMYNTLPQIDKKELQSAKNVILFVIDGLGYESVKKYGTGTVFEKYLKDKITTVFPSTTAAAITTFNTANAPQQHALTGWHTYVKELGCITTILPFMPRIGGESLGKYINPKLIFNQKTIFDMIKAEKYILTKKDIVDSDYTIAQSGKAKRYFYQSLSGCMDGLQYLVKKNNKRKFIYAYWADFDMYCHTYGVNSKKTAAHFKQLHKALQKTIAELQGTNTIIIITADHGLIDTARDKTIYLEDHPNLQKMLVMPLSGERRAAYCYVHPDKTKEFERYIKKHFSKMCELHKSKELIKQNYFGLFKPNEKLFERAWHYTLIMKENYIIIDSLTGEDRSWLKGIHGGLSEDEMYVPLIIIKYY